MRSYVLIKLVAYLLGLTVILNHLHYDSELDRIAAEVALKSPSYHREDSLRFLQCMKVNTMTTSSESTKYRAIPSVDHHTSRSPSTVLEAAREYIPGEAQTKWTYFLLGCAILLPWNAMVNATSFFLSRVAGSPLYSTFSSYWSSVYSLSKLGCQFYCTFTSKQSSPSHRIFTSIIAMFFFVGSLCLSTFIRGTASTYFAYALLATALTAVASGCLCTAVFAQAALLGESFLQVVFSGQAAIAVAISVVQVASSMIALWGSSPGSIEPLRSERDDQAEELAARIFFGISTAFLCITLAAYTWLTRRPFYQSAINTLERHIEVGVPDELTRLIVDSRRHSSTMLDSHVYQVFRHNLIFMFSLAYVFIVNVSVAPTVTARVRPANPNIYPMLFTSVHFFIYHAADLLGRYICSFPCFVVWSEKKILAMSLLRTLFVPLILLCNVDRPATSIPTLPILIKSDVVFMTITAALGYTTGYVSALALIAVSSLEHNPRLKGRREDVDIAAALGGSLIVVGVAIGSFCSFGVQTMI